MLIMEAEATTKMKGKKPRKKRTAGKFFVSFNRFNA